MHQPWHQQAACTRHNPETFYPDPSNTDAIAEAVAICHTCPVLGRCLTTALESREKHGIWGGTTEIERQRLIRAARRNT